MADTPLSSISLTTNPANGEFYVTIPNAGSPTGYDSRRITYANLASLLQAQITSNDGDIAGHESRITTLENITKIQKTVNQTSNFTFAQPAHSQISSIKYWSLSGGSMRIGTTLGGSEIMPNTSMGALTSVGINELESKLYSLAARTIYFTITGTISVYIEYRINITN